MIKFSSGFPFREDAIHPLEMVHLPELMRLTSGRAEVAIGMVDGPVVNDHPDLAQVSLREVPGKTPAPCARPGGAACIHGTFVAGILCGKRGSAAPAICPSCTLLVVPVFSEATQRAGGSPSATPEELAAAILTCIRAGAHVLNLSLAVTQSAARGQQALKQALDYAARSGVIVVAAAGNQGVVGGTIVTSHPWVISVAACDLRGDPLMDTNLGRSIGLRGLRAPGSQITSLGADGRSLTMSGTSAAAPFVTGAIALVWSQFPAASGFQLRRAFHEAHPRERGALTPPLLNAWAASQVMSARQARI
jgi:subtilisin family serine protease